MTKREVLVFACWNNGVCLKVF